MNIAAAAIFIVVTACAAVSVALPPPETIRVAIARDAETIAVGGDGVVFSDGKGNQVSLAMPAKLKASRDGLLAEGHVYQRLTASASGQLTINGRRYRGIIAVTSAPGGLLVVDELPLEDYLVGLINCEISSLWPMEAIKAQAVVARTYALFQKQSRRDAPYDLEATVLDQVYNGCDIEDGRSARGVRDTAGEVILYNGALIQAFYHSMCGGHTETSANVWGFGYPYLVSTQCDYCLTAPNVRWEQKIPLVKVEQYLLAAGYKVKGLKRIKEGERNGSGRLTTLALIGVKRTVSIPATAIRKAIGYGVIRSTNFTVRREGGNFIFSGIGNGHGVGLCQWGAKNQALQGATYREILRYYYKGTSVEKIYESNEDH